MCVHFKFPGLARVYSIYRIYVYSVIDPSGTFILGLVPAAELLLLVLCGSLTGGCVTGETILAILRPSVYSPPFSLDLVLVISLVVDLLMGFGLKLCLCGFSGFLALLVAVSTCCYARFCVLVQTSFCDIYIYI